MKTNEFVVNYLLNRASLHSLNGLTELDKFMNTVPTQQSKADPKADLYLSNIDNEISNAEWIADKLKEKGYLE